MDEASLLAALRHHWERVMAMDCDGGHEIYHDDAVLEFPQSQERFVGRENFKAWRRIYPADLEFKLRRISGRGDLWVTETSIRYDGGPWHFGCSITQFRGEKVAKETIYVAQGWEAPEWRAPWRAEWPEENEGAALEAASP